MVTIIPTMNVHCPYCNEINYIMFLGFDRVDTYDCSKCGKEFAVETKARVIATECDPCTQF